MFWRKRDQPLLDTARLIGQAKALRDAKRFPEAAEAYAKLVRRFDEWPERREEGLAPALSALGYTLSKSGDLRGAVSAYDRLADFEQERGRFDQAEFAWEAGARILGEAKEFDQSDERARKAIDAARKLEDPIVIASATYVLAQSLLLEDRDDEAERTLLGLNLELGDSDAASWARSGCYELLTRIAVKRGALIEARRWARKLEETMPRVNDPGNEYMAAVRQLLSQVHTA